MNLKPVFTILWTVGLAAASFGQGMRGGGAWMLNPAANPTVLLQRDDVRSDLQLTDDQKSKLFDMYQGIRDRFMEVARQSFTDDKERTAAFQNIGKKIAEEVNAVLTAGQQSRLKEIAIQISGFASATVKDIQKGLSLTDTQKTKIDDLKARLDEANKAAGEKVRSGEIQSADLQETLKKNQKVLNDEIGKILTQAQKDKIKSLGGKMFVPTPEPGTGG
jgi:hypothetical protein